MQFLTSVSLLLVALSATTSVVAHPVVVRSLETHRDAGNLQRRVGPEDLDEFGELADKAFAHREALGRVGKPGISFGAKVSG